VIDDTRLIEQTLHGSTAQEQQGAFGQLVRKYQDRLFNTVLQVVALREEAEDVVQEAFVQAYLKLSSFHGHSAFYTWLYRIAFNVSVSRRRRKKNESSLEAAREASGSDPADDVESPQENMLRQERAGMVHAALASLSEEHRTILVLRELEGFEYEQISDILDLPTGTVRSRLHRARLHLREQLKEMLEDSAAR
jgi:RNA polymerase sigma-70 factor, ECF subfamily